MKRFLRKFSKLPFVCLMVVGGLALSACEREEIGKGTTSGGYEEFTDDIDFENRKGIFGDGGLNIFGSSQPEGTGQALGVNSYLWRASLDTISFMPVNSADIFGGVIITDWHTPSEAPSERFKMNVYILGPSLRADGVRVAVFRQVQGTAGNWKDASVPTETGTRIEDAILTRARQLRNQSLN